MNPAWFKVGVMMEIRGGFNTKLAQVWMHTDYVAYGLPLFSKAQRKLGEWCSLPLIDQAGAWLDEAQSRMGATRPGRFSSEIELQNGETPCLRLTRNSRTASSWTIHATL
jgi:hypothetical protein